MTNENLPEPDFEFDEDEDNQEPDGYECNCCHGIQSHNRFGGMCNKCDAQALEPFWF